MLRQLADDLGNSPTIMEQFVIDYLSLLGPRLERMGQLLSSGDDEALVISILSLESTSAMIGAQHVVGTAHALRLAVEDHVERNRQGDQPHVLQHTEDAQNGVQPVRPHDDRRQAFDALQQAVAAARSALTELGFQARL